MNTGYPADLQVESSLLSMTFSEGQVASLNCTASESYPEANLRWYLSNAEQVHSSQFTIVKTSTSLVNDAFATRSDVTFSVTRTFNGVGLECGIPQPENGGRMSSYSPTFDVMCK